MININVKLNGSGKSVRSLASWLDAQVKAVMGGGRVKTTALDAFIGGPTQVVAKMITVDKTEYTVLICVVLGVGFPPALLLGLGGLRTNSDNPCLKPGVAPSGKPPSAQKEFSDPITQGIEGAGNLLKGLFGK